MATGKQKPEQLIPHMWKPGQSGNPSGRPKGIPSPTAELHRQLKANPFDLPKIIRTLIQLAQQGNLLAIQEIFVRTDGKVTERHELDARLPVTLVFQPVVQPHGDALQTHHNANLTAIDSEAVELPVLASDGDGQPSDFDSVATSNAAHSSRQAVDRLGQQLHAEV